MGSEFRLKDREIISEIFRSGTAIKAYPILGIYVRHRRHEGAQIGFSVSRKKIRKAVDRNLIKRRMRESVRLQMDLVHPEGGMGVALMLIYHHPEVMEFAVIQKSVQVLLKKLNRHLSESAGQSTSG